jgi:large subunit ribosomal protein L9
MKVILLKDLDTLGKTGDTKEVKRGYAINFLIPRGYAAEFSPSLVKQLQEKRKIQEIHEKKEKEIALKLKEKIATLSCTIYANAGEEDRLFGTVTNLDVQKALEREGVAVDKKHISFEEEIAKLGVYRAHIKLHPEVDTFLKIWVVKK